MTKPDREIALIGLGANLGDARATVLLALGRLQDLPDTTLVAVSSIHRTKPWEATGPDFYNAVAKVQTSLAPQRLLEVLQSIEQEFGRKRPFKNAPRTLDLDLLVQGNHRLNTPVLTVPHPRMHERAFVLLPLLELAPDLYIEGQGTAKDCLGKIAP
jgi:2-amino-4-hydroxy-6-hydroxymethyldihydropteridine diphosphokinase